MKCQELVHSAILRRFYISSIGIALGTMIGVLGPWNEDNTLQGVGVTVVNDGASEC